jgi:hypothetical protein
VTRWRGATSSGIEVWQNSTANGRLNRHHAAGRRSRECDVGSRDFVDLRPMHLRHFRNQPKLPDQRARFVVRGFPFERVPVDRLAVGN